MKNNTHKNHKRNLRKKLQFTCIAAPLDGWTPSMRRVQGRIKQGLILTPKNYILRHPQSEAQDVGIFLWVEKSELKVKFWKQQTFVLFI